MKVTGFHGTTAGARQDIEENGLDVARQNGRPKWLGLGFYFFQDAPTAAWQWAGEASGRRRGEKPLVLQATLDLKDSIDLLDIRYWDLFQRAIPELGLPPRTQLGPEALFRTRSAQEERQLYSNYADDHYVTGFVGFLETKGQSVRSIRAAFIEGEPIHPSSWLFKRAHVAICVRDGGVVENEKWLEST